MEKKNSQMTHKSSMTLKEFVCRPLRQDWVDAQIWGRVQKNFCCYEGHSEYGGLHPP